MRLIFISLLEGAFHDKSTKVLPDLIEIDSILLGILYIYSACFNA